METVIVGVGRGRGNATNVPERSLIEQVRVRPVLYDKKRGDYRKPGVSDLAWCEVATSLDISVTNCKKRWKSLRDTFIKYYRLEVMYAAGESRRKHKTWNFYQDLLFLKQHVELFRLEESYKEGLETTSNFVKENNGESSDSERRYLIEEDGSKEVYEIKIANEEFMQGAYTIKEDHLLDVSYEEEQIEEVMDEYGILEQEEEVGDKSVDKNYGDNFDGYEAENEHDDHFEVNEDTIVPPTPPTVQASRLQSEIEVHQTPPQDHSEHAVVSSSPSKNIVDPDERYLMSCLPAFKRFTPQQRAYVRMGIEKLFYEVEFENVSEPKCKHSRIS